MKISPKLRNNLARILPFGFIWGFSGLMYALLEYSVLGGTSVYPRTLNPYNFSNVLPLITVSTLIMGIFFGTLEVLLFKRIFRNRTFVQKIVFKAFITIFILLFLLLGLASLIKAASLNLSIFHLDVVNSVLDFASQISFWIAVFYGGITTILSLLFSEISNYLGEKEFNNFFSGRYHTPKIEERIFMFLDMKSSTTIAEKLGHEAYFHLLNKYYGHATRGIILTHGEIYQYAGDEIIVSWKMAKGLEDGNCIRCFYMMKERIERRASSYMEEFGLVPQFKAGFHYGEVTTGEIGDLKKEIFFTGDVLNTASRIQANCNNFKSDLLISEDLLERIGEHDFFSSQEIGKCKLKGREEKIKLFSITATPDSQLE